nr:hypothetical protein [Sulfurimonas sp.]
MKEIFTISSGVDVAKVKPVGKGLKEVADGDAKSSKSEFLSILTSQINKSIKNLDSKSELSIELKTTTTVKDIGVELEVKGKEKSLGEHLLEDLLKVVSLLDNPNFKISSLPSLSNNLTKLINSETAIKELKSINNITDLLKLSKKYDLGLEKLSVKNIDLVTLKKEFPQLAKKEF